MNYIQQLQHNITSSRRVRAASSFIFHSAAEQSDFSVHAAQLRTHTPAGHGGLLVEQVEVCRLSPGAFHLTARRGCS